MLAYRKEDQIVYKNCVGKLLSTLRSENQLTLEEVAQRADTTKQSVSLYEKGVKVPQIWTMKRIAEAHGLTISAFISRIEKEFHAMRRKPL